MAINRDIWKKGFFKDQIPDWICSTCGMSNLSLKEESLIFLETNSSREYRDKLEDAWDVEFTELGFSAIFVCNNKSCSENFYCCGKGIKAPVEVVYDDRHYLEYPEYFIPEYFYPALDMFRVPSVCPKEIADEVKNSFKLFFCSPEASANYVRKSIEIFLDTQSVRSCKPGKSNFIPLENRITEYSKKDEMAKVIAEKLRAIKWIGNAGSHSGKNGLTKDDILDAYEILELIIEDIYVQHRQNIERKTTMINKKKGPINSEGS